MQKRTIGLSLSFLTLFLLMILMSFLYFFLFVIIPRDYEPVSNECADRIAQEGLHLDISDYHFCGGVNLTYQDNVTLLYYLVDTSDHAEPHGSTSSWNILNPEDIYPCRELTLFSKDSWVFPRTSEISCAFSITSREEREYRIANDQSVCEKCRVEYEYVILGPSEEGQLVCLLEIVFNPWTDRRG